MFDQTTPEQWLHQLQDTPSSTGECDICHADGVPLFEDHGQQGHFEYCEACIRKIAAKQQAREDAYNQDDYDRDYPNGAGDRTLPE